MKGRPIELSGPADSLDRCSSSRLRKERVSGPALQGARHTAELPAGAGTGCGEGATGRIAPRHNGREMGGKGQQMFAKQLVAGTGTKHGAHRDLVELGCNGELIVSRRKLEGPHRNCFRCIFARWREGPSRRPSAGRRLPRRTRTGRRSNSRGHGQGCARTRHEGRGQRQSPGIRLRMNLGGKVVD